MATWTVKAERAYPPIEADTDYEPMGGPKCGLACCRTCPRWRCQGCNKLRPWCLGANDNMPSLCNFCWYARTHAPRTRAN